MPKEVPVPWLTKESWNAGGCGASSTQFQWEAAWHGCRMLRACRMEQTAQHESRGKGFLQSGRNRDNTQPACCLLPFFFFLLLFFFVTTPDFEGPAVSFLLWACSRHMTAHRWIRVWERAHERQGQEPAPTPRDWTLPVNPRNPRSDPSTAPIIALTDRAAVHPGHVLWTLTRENESALQQILDCWKSFPETGMSPSPWPQGWKRDRGKRSFLTPLQKSAWFP